MSHPVKPVENYTRACLVMGVVNLLWVFLAILGFWGWGAVFIIATLLNTLITWIGDQRVSARRQTASDITPPQ